MYGRGTWYKHTLLLDSIDQLRAANLRNLRYQKCLEVTVADIGIIILSLK